MYFISSLSSVHKFSIYFHPGLRRSFTCKAWKVAIFPTSFWSHISLKHCLPVAALVPTKQRFRGWGSYLSSCCRFLGIPPFQQHLCLKSSLPAATLCCLLLVTDQPAVFLWSLPNPRHPQGASSAHAHPPLLTKLTSGALTTRRSWLQGAAQQPPKEDIRRPAVCLFSWASKTASRFNILVLPCCVKITDGNCRTAELLQELCRGVHQVSITPHPPLHNHLVARDKSFKWSGIAMKDLEEEAFKAGMQSSAVKHPAVSGCHFFSKSFQMQPKGLVLTLKARGPDSTKTAKHLITLSTCSSLFLFNKALKHILHPS